MNERTEAAKVIYDGAHTGAVAHCRCRLLRTVDESVQEVEKHDGYQKLRERLAIQDALAKLLPDRGEAIESLVTD